MRAKPLASIVSVAFVLAMGACGNDDNGKENVATTAESTVSKTAESTSGKGDTDKAKTPTSTSGKGDTDKAKTPTSTSGKRGSAKAVTPKAKELAACLKKAGYAPTVIPAPPEGAPGAEFGSVGTVRVNVSPDNGVAAVFLKDAKKAKDLRKRFREGGLGGRGTAEVIGAVYLAANQGRPKALKAFRTCLEG